MKIYFACSIRGGRGDADIYAALVEHIKTKATVLTEIFADGNLTAAGMGKPSRDIWSTDVAWVKQSGTGSSGSLVERSMRKLDSLVERSRHARLIWLVATAVATKLVGAAGGFVVATSLMMVKKSVTLELP